MSTPFDVLRSVDASDTALLERVVALIAGQQQRRDRLVIYLGEQAEGIRAELDALSPPWTDTLRITERDGTLVGVALTDWDEGVGRAWISGPWIEGDDDVWARCARPLVMSQLDQLPSAITSHELAGSVENDRLAQLAAELGWVSSEVNLAYVLRADAAGDLPPAEGDGLRGVVPEDDGVIGPLHEQEFPSTYFSAQQLIERASAGEQVVLVATTDTGRFAGYAAGRVQPDGIGYIDFVAVEPDARGAGAGRRLVAGLAARLLPDAPKQEVHLTVQEHRTPARSLYEALGFRVDVGFVSYRSP